jgi:hypothetical protein
MTKTHTVTDNIPKYSFVEPPVPHPEWSLKIFDNIYYSPDARAKIPNWFQRKMYKVFFDFEWVRK